MPLAALVNRSIVPSVMGSLRSHLIYCVLLTAFKFLIAEGQRELCTQASPTLLPYGKKCEKYLQCATNRCYNGLCVCPTAMEFDSCTSSCLPKCNSSTTSSSTGRIFGPNYPHNTEKYYCYWTIKGYNSNSYVVFRLIDLDLGINLDCKTNFFEAIDEGSSSKLYKSCTNQENRLQIFASRYHTLKIIFQQGSIGYRTFAGIYRIFDYNSTLRETSGYFASPGFSQQIPSTSSASLNSSALRYTWTILGKSITVRFSVLQLQSCCDKIYIHTGIDEKAPLLRVLTSMDSVYTILSGELHIIFQSTGGKPNSGFSAEYFFKGLEHGEVCNTAFNGMCKSYLTCNYSRTGETRCLCKTGKYFSRNKCLDSVSFVYKVGVDVISISPPSDVSKINYSLTWSTPGEFGQRSYNNILSRNFSVIDLTPGQSYNFQFTTYFSADNLYEGRFITSSVSAVTLPSRPGNVIPEESHLLRAPYIIKFTPSKGLVRYYTAAIRSFNSFYLYNVTSPEVNTSDLTPGTEYDVTITAYNFLHNDSMSFSGKFKTAPEEEKDYTIIIVAVVAGVVGLVVLVIIVVVLIRRKHNRNSQESSSFDLNMFEVKSKSNKEKEKDRNLARPYGALPSAAQLAMKSVVSTIQQDSYKASTQSVNRSHQMEDVQDTEDYYGNASSLASADKKRYLSKQNDTEDYYGNTSSITNALDEAENEENVNYLNVDTNYENTDFRVLATKKTGRGKY